MAQYKQNFKEAISNWNKKNPTLRKKTLSSIANEMKKSVSALSQIDKNNSANQFQKHCIVIFESKIKSKQKETFELYKKADITIINTLAKFCEILECDIWDLVTIIESEK